METGPLGPTGGTPVIANNTPATPREPEHTPGPWLVDKDSTHTGQICTVHGVEDEMGEPCWVEIWSTNWPDGRTQSHNARLIAAAPDMLKDGFEFSEAAWDLLQEYSGGEFHVSDEDQSQWAQAMRRFLRASDRHRAALAKAGLR